MRYVYLALLVLLAAVTALFALQNLQTVTITFFSWNLTLPVALVVAGAYILGMVSGGSVASFLRWSMHRVKRT